MDHFVEEGVYWRVCMDCHYVVGIEKTNEPHMLNEISHTLCKTCFDKRKEEYTHESNCD